jgi:hypothetical protein
MWSYTFGFSELWSMKRFDWLISSQTGRLRPLPITRQSYIAAVIGVLSLAATVFPQAKSPSISEETAASWARECARQIASAIESAEERGDLGINTAFDRMYIPIPGTTPRRYKTAYDSWADRVIEPILSETLNKHKGLVYIFLTDPNGYVPVAPAVSPIHQIPSPPAPKRILETESDREVARMAAPQLIRSMNNPSGDMITEIAVPVIVRSRSWCVLRLAYIEP